MSTSLVRKALEISDDSKKNLSVFEKSLKNAAKRKLRSIEKRRKNKLSPEATLKRNLKLLKALEAPSTSSSKSKDIHKPKASSSSPTESTSKSKKSKKKKGKKNIEESTIFTEEDFKKFEEEYFVTD